MKWFGDCDKCCELVIDVYLIQSGAGWINRLFAADQDGTNYAIAKAVSDDGDWRIATAEAWRLYDTYFTRLSAGPTLGLTSIVSGDPFGLFSAALVGRYTSVFADTFYSSCDSSSSLFSMRGVAGHVVESQWVASRSDTFSTFVATGAIRTYCGLVRFPPQGQTPVVVPQGESLTSSFGTTGVSIGAYSGDEFDYAPSSLVKTDYETVCELQSPSRAVTIELYYVLADQFVHAALVLQAARDVQEGATPSLQAVKIGDFVISNPNSDENVSIGPVSEFSSFIAGTDSFAYIVFLPTPLKLAANPFGESSPNTFPPRISVSNLPGQDPELDLEFCEIGYSRTKHRQSVVGIRRVSFA